MWTWSRNRKHCCGQVHTNMMTQGPLCVGGRDKVWDLPLCEIFDLLGHLFHGDGCKALRSWRDQVHLSLKDSPTDDQV